MGQFVNESSGSSAGNQWISRPSFDWKAASSTISTRPRAGGGARNIPRVFHYVPNAARPGEDSLPLAGWRHIGDVRGVTRQSLSCAGTRFLVPSTATREALRDEGEQKGLGRGWRMVLLARIIQEVLRGHYQAGARHWLPNGWSLPCAEVKFYWATASCASWRSRQPGEAAGDHPGLSSALGTRQAADRVWPGDPRRLLALRNSATACLANTG